MLIFHALFGDLTRVAIHQVASVALECNAGDFEGIEQDVGEVVWSVVGAGVGHLVDALVTLEVVEELEPEFLVGTVLLLGVLVVGVHQTDKS